MKKPNEWESLIFAQHKQHIGMAPLAAKLEFISIINANFRASASIVAINKAEQAVKPEICLIYWSEGSISRQGTKEEGCCKNRGPSTTFYRCFLFRRTTTTTSPTSFRRKENQGTRRVSHKEEVEVHKSKRFHSISIVVRH